jgi:4-diphosphocytidyl-2C-methyl-D-erythritol kinase
MDGSDPIRGVYIESPAKINLHLEILGTRSDGYHEIDSIFQLVSLYDGIWIRSLKESDVLTIGDGQIIEDGLCIEGMSYIPKNENIICKALMYSGERQVSIPGFPYGFGKRYRWAPGSEEGRGTPPLF